MKSSNASSTCSTQSLVTVEDSNIKPDFFILMENHIFPIQKNNLKLAGFFNTIDMNKRKTLVIEEKFDVKMLLFRLKLSNSS